MIHKDEKTSYPWSVHYLSSNLMWNTFFDWEKEKKKIIKTWEKE